MDNLNGKLKDIEQFYTEHKDDSDNIELEINFRVQKMFDGGTCNYKYLCEPIITEMIWLLCYIENYEKLSIEHVIELLSNQEAINKILKQTNKKFGRIESFISANKITADLLYDNILELINSAEKSLADEIYDNILVEENNYQTIEKELFKFNGTFFEAQYVIFCGLKVEQLNVMCDLDEGLKILYEINKKYENSDIRMECAHLLMEDGYATEWDESITTKEEAYKTMDQIMEINVLDESIRIWFETTDSYYGGHNPILELYLKTDYKCAGVE